MQQYFVDQPLEINSILELDADDEHHIVNVMRHQVDDLVRISNQEILVYAVIIELAPLKLKVIEVLQEDKELTHQVTLVMSLVKGNNFEYVLQKATELGVSKIIPYQADRSVVKVNKKFNKKLVRYQKIIQEAAEQSERRIIPKITMPKNLETLSEEKLEQNIVLYERQEGNHLLKQAKAKDSLLIIGPEGGFSDRELDFFAKEGFMSLSLGKRILRAETAAISALSLIGGIIEYEE